MSNKAALNGLLLSFCALATSAVGQEQSAIPTTDENSKAMAQQCVSESAIDRQDRDSIAACVEQARVEQAEQKVEKITVTGKYIGLQVPEVEGRFVLDRSLINYMPRTGGDFTEMLELLPGIELGAERYDADQQGEIQAQRVSLMGAQSWQTGFFMNGMNFNSRQDPQTYRNGDALVNDVEGTTQIFNINQNVIDSITVYTNNIPARFGGFSGGVVDIETREAVGTQPSFGFSYRTSKSDWNRYRTFLSEEVTEGDEETPEEPSFSKDAVNLNMSVPLGEHYSLMVAGNYTTSEITKLSLNQPVLTERENANLMMTLTQRDLFVDKLSLTVNYSPYESRDILTNVQDSEYEIKGGGISTSVKLQHSFDTFSLNSRLSYSVSDNSRYASPHYYPWAKVTGKDWGVGDSSEDTSVSNQGGYGDLEKQQKNIMFDTYASFNEFEWLGINHSTEVGFQYQNENLTRERFYDSYVYNSPITGVSQLDCNGSVFDCVELSTSISIADLEAQLGEPLDFSNPDHVLAYANIVTDSPQYFSLRTVYSQEYLDVGVQVASLYATDKIEAGNLNINLGVRVDYDDFLKNINIAPRFSSGYQVFGSSDKLITFGLNRYYDANLLTYKVREQQTPSRIQRRAISQSGTVQSWADLAGGSDYRYIFNDLDTPYNDEVSFGWKQGTRFGNYAIEYVKRWQKAQLTNEGDPVYNPQDGFYYRGQSNEASGYSDRISLSWAYMWREHSFWANTSYILNESYNDDAIENVNTAAFEDLIFIRDGNDEDGYTYTENTLNNLDIISSEFSRPLSINLGWTSSWTETLTSSVTATYRTAYEDYEATDDLAPSEQIDRLNLGLSADDAFLIPVYERKEFPTRILFNASLTYEPRLIGAHGVQLRLDVQNMFNQRTYSVAEGNAGIETGRSIWFEVGYQWH